MMLHSFILVLLVSLGRVAVGMPDCSSATCPSTCSCVESKCGASMYANCSADSQCNALMTCLLKCSCNNVLCALGCVAGKTLDPVSEQVKTCASPCATSLDCSGEAFLDYKVQFGKTYGSSIEESERRGLFIAACTRVNELNEQNGEASFGLTHLTDRRPSEMPKRGRKGMGDDRFVLSAPVLRVAESVSPASIDWRLTPAVTAVKNQGQCGSCWAFSAVETIESQYIMDVDESFQETFSPQQVASCTSECYGCGGGDTVTAYQYLMNDAPGLASNYFWPYVQGPMPADNCGGPNCTQSCGAHNISVINTTDGKFYIGPYAKITGFKYATPPCTNACEKQDLQTLAASLERGPVSVCVNAGAWDNYVGGVMTSKTCGSMSYDDQDHCVQLVGFNTTAPTPYWIVRNSWATSWGIKGYIHLEMAKNTCGLADEATIPSVGNARADASDRRAAMLRHASQGWQRSVVV